MQNLPAKAVAHSQSSPFLKSEFGERLVHLNNGGLGIRGGLRVEIKSPQSDTPEPVLDFIASDESVDRYNEVIKLDGWDLANYKRNPVVVDSHDYSSVSKILGRSTEVAVSMGKLVNRVKFATDNPLGAMAYKLAKGGFIKSESVGFIPTEWTYGDESAGEPYRIFTKQELIEISLVAVPANPAATMVLALKSGVLEKTDLQELARFLKQFCSDEADTLPDSSARGNGVDGAQLRQINEAIKTIRV